MQHVQYRVKEIANIIIIRAIIVEENFAIGLTERKCATCETPCIYKYTHICKWRRKMDERCSILYSRQTSHATKFRGNSRKFVTPIPWDWRQAKRRGWDFLLKILQICYRNYRTLRHTRGLFTSEEVIYFVPSLHKLLTLSWKRRPSGDVASRSLRQLNPRIVVIEYLDPQCHPIYSESREAWTLLSKF